MKFVGAMVIILISIVKPELLLFQVDEKTRASMFKLRHTWTDIFPEKKLYNIDLGCHSVDPAWPVAAKPPPVPAKPPTPTLGKSIHVNPKFIKRNKVCSLKKNPDMILTSSFLVHSVVL